MNPIKIFNNVMYWVSVLLKGCSFKSEPFFLDQLALEALHLPVMFKRYKGGRWVV